MHFGEDFIKQKLLGTPNSGGRSPFWTLHQDPEGLGSCVLLEPWYLTFKETLLNQSCSVYSK